MQIEKQKKEALHVKVLEAKKMRDQMISDASRKKREDLANSKA